MPDALHIKDKSEIGKLIKVSPFRKEIRNTQPHKHNSYLELIYLSQGNGIHKIDNRTYNIIPPVLYLVRKEQIHHWQLNSEPDGFVLILKNEFVNQSIDGELKKLLIRISNFNAIQLKDTNTIESLFQILTRENGLTIIEGLIKALLAKALEVHQPISQGTSTRKHLFQSYHSLLNLETTYKNSVSHYAKLLNTTPQNLNSACQKAANQTAGEVLADYILSEAKRLLLYTDQSVAEIAFDLSFNDPSHFIKYFKKHQNITPHAFRSHV